MSNPCLPPSGTAPGSVHVLQKGTRRVTREWNGRGWVLAPTRNYEPAEHVAAGGWRYIGPKDADHPCAGSYTGRATGLRPEARRVEALPPAKDAAHE